MSATKVAKSKPVETPGNPAKKVKPVKVRATNGESELKVPGKNRAASCPRCTPSERSKTAPAGHHVAPKTISQRKTRSSSMARKLTPDRSKANADDEKPTCSSSVKQAAVETKCGQETACSGQRQQVKSTSHSYKAFTVIPPDPKKRMAIQRKAEAELAALEELRQSRAMAYVSINPSSVGGCLSLEEVRLKQQQEMMQAKRKPRQKKKQVMVLTS